MPLRTPAPNTFEIGLAMAGAASAGAYTAGIIDFMLEALQAWQEVKESGDPSVPDHEVQIRVAAGASAGSIATFLAMLPFTGHFPMRDLATVVSAADAENAKRNLLYKGCVSDVDIRRMLETDDLNMAAGCIPSLFNGTVLSDVAEAAIATVRAASTSASQPLPPRYLADSLQVYLSLTNMGGLPYIVCMVADETMRGKSAALALERDLTARGLL